MNNNFINQYNQYNKNNVPFQNNSLLAQNPNNLTNNRMFQQQLHMVKMQQIQRAEKVNNLKLSDKEISNYVICPIKVEKISSNEFNNELSQKENEYVDEKNNQKLKEFWNGRTNMPYKNILKNEDYSKDFKSKKDLIVHKVTNEDKIGIIDKFEEHKKVIDEQDDQLKITYSKDEKLKHKKDFQYKNVYKYRLKHNPKDYNELKDIYKKEQESVDKEEKKIDNLINTLLEGDLLSDIEKKEAESELKKMQNDKEISIKKNSNSNHNFTKLTKNKSIDDEIELLKKELGPDFKNIVDELEGNNDTSNNTSNNTEKPNKKIIDKTQKKVKISISNKKNKEDENENLNNIGKIDNDLLNKYKNRNK